MKQFEDVQITCVDCKQNFTDRASDQAFRAEKGFDNAPKRCKPCRVAKKARMENGGDNRYGQDRNHNNKYGSR